MRPSEAATEFVAGVGHDTGDARSPAPVCPRTAPAKKAVECLKGGDAEESAVVQGKNGR